VHSCPNSLTVRYKIRAGGTSETSKIVIYFMNGRGEMKKTTIRILKYEIRIELAHLFFELNSV
jgi:hypothetical protein